IGAGASIFSGIMGGSAASKAAKIQAANAEKVAALTAKATQGAKDDLNSNATAANGVLGNVYNDLNGKINPYLDAGKEGITSLAAALRPGGALADKFSFNPVDLEKDPGYQFQLEQGMKALQNSGAASGAGGSGGFAK